MIAGVSLGMAYVAGLAGFLAPCTLVLLPLFLVHLAGAGLLWGRRAPRGLPRLLLLSALVFAVGFGVAFVAAWSFPDLFQGRGPATPLINRASGVLLILAGLLAAGLLGWGLVHRLQVLWGGRLAAYGLSFIVGLSFALGWTPCVGATLGEVLSLTAGPQGGAGAVLLGVYTAGLMAPFLVLGWGAGWAMRGVAAREGWTKWATPVIGLVLIGMGVTVFTGNLRELTGYLFALTPGLLLI